MPRAVLHPPQSPFHWLFLLLSVIWREIRLLRPGAVNGLSQDCAATNGRAQVHLWGLLTPVPQILTTVTLPLFVISQVLMKSASTWRTWPQLG